MKHINMAAACAGLIAWAASSAIAAESILPADIRPNLFGACFISEQEGWVIGDLGRILYTTDGGKTFERLDAGTKRAFLGIACFPDKTLILSGKMGIIYRSNDGGRTWQAQKSGTDKNLVSLAFTSRDVGIAVGDAGTIVRTQDGGATWEKIAVPEQIPLPEEIAETVAPGDILLYDVSFATPDRAWIVGEFGVILASTDGGLTWTAQTSTVQSTLFGTTFTDANNGWTVGLAGVMLRTRDGGQTWERVKVPSRPGFSLSLYSVKIAGQYGWAIGDSGYLLSSTDAGESWKLADVPIQLAGSWFRGVSLVPDGRGLIVGADGLMLVTDRATFSPTRKL
ncbi:MAG TPA: YCF48-related protein [Candidatus Kryptonia bacterium]|nr:YCF48-related protein [Candidatus Kryptonia bacterium]